VLELPENPDELVSRLKQLVEERRKLPRPRRRLSLTTKQRATVLAKTDARCHLCGGRISAGEKFAADHVLAHAAGGPDKLANYLAAHVLCNATRWFYSQEEFQWILRMGKWARKQIEDRTPLGQQMSEKFLESEQSVRNRRYRNSSSANRQLRAIDLFGKIDFVPAYDHKENRKRRRRTS
jgi:hypothetical protein